MSKVKELHQFKDKSDKGYGSGHIECSCGWIGPIADYCPAYYDSESAKLTKILHLLGELSI